MRVTALAIAWPSFARSSRGTGRLKRPGDLIDDLQPSLLLVVGIAGGLPSDDISLGDVVLSTRLLDFSVEARKFQEHTTYNVGGGPQAHHHGSDVGVRCGYSRASCAARPVISRRAFRIVTPDLRRANTRR